MLLLQKHIVYFTEKNINNNYLTNYKIYYSNYLYIINGSSKYNINH